MKMIRIVTRVWFPALTLLANLAASAQTATMVESSPPECGNAAPAAAERETRTAWWREAKFGMFIHWGLYSMATVVRIETN